jgi:hypothetical protein
MRIPSLGMLSSAALVGLQAVASAALLSTGMDARADEPQVVEPDATPQRSWTSVLKPRAFFAQLGVADEVTAGTAGAIWNPKWDFLHEPWSVYLEGSVSRWQSRGGHPTEHGVLTQLALIPVFRYRMDQGRSPWFAEGGVGATVTSSVYRSGDTHFSTSFNFGDHLGVGYSFGAARTHEIALRAEHFSNGGIKHPNPGKNFVELRYVHHFE